jgi:hypothetical protein
MKAGFPRKACTCSQSVRLVFTSNSHADSTLRAPPFFAHTATLITCIVSKLWACTAGMALCCEAIHPSNAHNTACVQLKAWRSLYPRR